MFTVIWRLSDSLQCLPGICSAVTVLWDQWPWPVYCVLSAILVLSALEALRDALYKYSTTTSNNVSLFGILILQRL